jgi:hypothetical protein
MPLILPGNVASATASTGYDVDNSCRFNDGDSAYLEISGSTPSDRKKFTYSFWFKRGALGTDQVLLSFESDGDNRGQIMINSSDQFRYFERSGGSNTINLITTRVFRDVSAFYHIVLSVDTTQATDTNRVKIYINGTQVTAFGTETYPSQNYDTVANGTYNKNIGRRNVNTDMYLDGYLAEVVFVDGTQQANTDLGEFDSDSPTIWKPKDVSGLTFGDNGFYLDMKDATDFGQDVSGNSNDFTEDNLDATDQATDTPTNNFCTMNPLDNYYFDGTFSQGNCHVVSDSSSMAYNTGTLGMTAGKWYWEIEFDARSIADYDYSRIGFAGVLADDASSGFQGLGTQAHNYSYYGINGHGYYSNLGPSSGGADLGTTYTVGDIISVALDLTNGKVYYAKNGTWVNSGDPESGATGTGSQPVLAASTTTIGAYLPALNFVDHTSTGTWKCNFGGCSAFTVSSANQDADGYGNFEYAVPSGYYALCTKNLAEYG